jgi:hypothetical protein
MYGVRFVNARKDTVMPDTADYLMSAMLIGVGATIVLDLSGLVQKWLLRTPFPDYGLVGRWFLHMTQGRFRHASIAAARPLPGEHAIGWIAHYLIGIAYAAILLAIWGVDWARHPTLLPALIVGIGSIAAPFLLMQPGMGAGIAASRTPNPGAARLRSLTNHASFALGLYAAGWAQIAAS